MLSISRFSSLRSCTALGTWAYTAQYRVRLRANGRESRLQLYSRYSSGHADPQQTQTHGISLSADSVVSGTSPQRVRVTVTERDGAGSETTPRAIGIASGIAWWGTV